MNKVFALLLAVSVMTAPQAFAQKVSQPGNQPLVDQVIEKQLMGRLFPGHRPMISVKKPSEAMLSKISASGPVQMVSQPLTTAAVIKTYAVTNDAYQSQLEVKDDKGQVLTHINVGRRIHRMIASSQKNRIYVLCGGYFGSVWEIDTLRDVVVKKLPAFTPGLSGTPVWNPNDIALSKDGTMLAIGSGKVQVIDTLTGALEQEIMLPEDALNVTHIAAAGGNSFRLSVRMENGSIKGFQTVGEDLKPSATAARSIFNPHKVKVRTGKAMAPAASRLMFMASRNADYIRMVDKQSLMSMGLLPVDFPVDDLELSPDRKKLFAYHQRFGQLSIIDLNPRSPNQYATIKRIRDPRFKANLQLASSVDSVYLWNGSGKILAGFQQDSLYPRIGIPFGVRLMPSVEQQVWVSRPAHQRYYVRSGMLYSEYMGKGPARVSDAVNLGSQVVDLKISPDRRTLYVLSDTAELLQVDAMSRTIKKRLPLGMNPGMLALSSDGNTLTVADKNEGLLREVDTRSFKVARQVFMDMNDKQSYHITLFDPDLTQVIEVELPRFSENVVRVSS